MEIQFRAAINNAATIILGHFSFQMILCLGWIWKVWFLGHFWSLTLQFSPTWLPSLSFHKNFVTITLHFVFLSSFLVSKQHLIVDTPSFLKCFFFFAFGIKPSWFSSFPSGFHYVSFVGSRSTWSLNVGSSSSCLEPSLLWILFLGDLTHLRAIYITSFKFLFQSRLVPSSLHNIILNVHHQSMS